MELLGIEKQGKPEHNFKYNGKELQSDLGLNWYDYGARFYDPQLGRWHMVDPLANNRLWLSPYNFCSDNPINKVDLTGALDDWVETNGKMFWDDRVSDQATANQFYGASATYRAPGYSYIASGNIDVVLGDNRNFTQSGVSKTAINATPSVIGNDIMNHGWDKFIHYYEKLGQDYFFNAANQNYTDNATGIMRTIKENIAGIEEAIRISQMTHDWVGQVGSGWTSERNRLEHQIGMFLMSDKYGEGKASFIGESNEYRGFWINDRQSGNMWNAFLGNPANNGGPTAFEWDDLQHNLEGIRKWREYRNVNMDYIPYKIPESGTLEFEFMK